MVGGIADWFAVTALFRHPLGLPIPHTAIIPRNKDRIGDALAPFLRDNFLTPSVVARRMRRSTSPAPSAASSPAARRGPAARRAARGCSPTFSKRSTRSGSAAWSRARSPQRMRVDRGRAPARPDAGRGDQRGAARADGRRHRHLGRPHPRRQRGSDPRHGPPARRLDPAHGRARREARRRHRRRPPQAHASTWRSIPTTRCAPRPRKALAASPTTSRTIPKPRPRSRRGRTR